jgi:iron complex outermembrane receptor protein
MRRLPQVVFALAAASAPALHAQSAASAPSAPPADEAVQLSAFVVDTSKDRGYAAANAISATKLNTPIKDLPFGISVYTEDYMKDRLAYTVQDAMRFSAFYNPDNGTIRGLRGAGQRMKNGFGEYFGRHSTASVGRVEVLKGPASVIYGIAYPGGFVNPISKRPDPRDEVEVATEFGWENNWAVRADVNEVVNPKLSVRLNAEYRDRRSRDTADAFKRAVEFDEVTDQNYHLAVQLRPWRATEFLYDIEVFRSEGWEGDDWSLRTDNDVPLRELYPIPDGYSYQGPDTITGDDNVAHLFVANHRWSEMLTTEFIATGMWRANRRYGQTRFASTIAVDPATNRRAARLQWERITDDNSSWHFQLKNLFTFKTGGAKHNVLAQAQRSLTWGGRKTFMNSSTASGANQFYFYPLEGVTDFGAIDRRQPANINYVTRPNNLTRNNRYSTQLTLIHQGEFPLGNGKFHTVAGGVNYSHYTSSLNRGSGVDSINRRDTTVPTAGVAWAPNPRWSWYALYAESFNPDNRLDGFDRPLPPATGESLEAGFKVDSADKRLSGTVTVFKSREANRRVNDPEAPNRLSFGVNPALPISATNPIAPNSPKGANIAVGKYDSEGLEAEGIVSPLPNLQLVLSYMFNDAAISADPVALQIGRRDTGHTPHSAAFWTKYVFVNGALKGLSVGGGYRWSADKLRFYRVANNANVEYELPGARRLDLYGAYVFRVFARETTVQINLENLAREKVYVGNRPGTVVPYGYELPARWFVTFSTRL